MIKNEVKNKSEVQPRTYSDTYYMFHASCLEVHTAHTTLRH